MSEIKVDTVAEKTSANGVTIDGLNIKDGKLTTATAITGHTAEATVADDDLVLISDTSASAALKKMTVANLVANVGGGITEADSWRLTANTTSNGDVTANWERVDNNSFGRIGTGLSQSSGIFSFASTGYYYILISIAFNGEFLSSYNAGHLMTTINNSDYANAVLCETAHEGNVGNSVGTQAFIFDVTNTTNCKMKVNWGAQHSSIAIVGNTDKTRTGITALRIGDT
jgi:hypothetical protein|tara:strand:+ start:50 stop:733 length:684 start_codon:yes stop_codon:yes gene_type:complete